MARRVKRPNISLDEINIQIALGTLTAPQHIASFIECTKDQRAIIWASKHANHKIREAAVSNPVCPIAVLINACIRDKATAVTNSAKEALEKRRKETDDFLLVTESYPQLSFAFYDNEKVVEDSDDHEHD